MVQLTDAISGRVFYLNPNFIVRIESAFQGNCNVFTVNGIYTVQGTAEDIAALVDSK